ncbi:hypothetical protein FRC11_010344, partial [Ceratobasidium sp. 423]
MPLDDQRFPGRTFAQVSLLGEDTQEWQVEKILHHQGRGPEAEFEIQWKTGDRTWEPYSNVKHLSTLEDYFEALGIEKVSELPYGEVAETGAVSNECEVVHTTSVSACGLKLYACPNTPKMRDFTRILGKGVYKVQGKDSRTTYTIVSHLTSSTHISLTMNQPSLVTTLETMFTPAQRVMFMEYDWIIKAREHFEPGENATAYGIYCMMRDTMREQMLAQHMNGPYLSVQYNPNFSFHPYASTHMMNSAYPHGPAVPPAHAPSFYTAYPPVPDLPPYPHGHTLKPRSRHDNWKGKRDYQGPKTDKKLYMGKKKGRGEDITVTKTARAPGTRQHMAPAIDPYMEHLHAHTMADAFNHTNTLDMSM